MKRMTTNITQMEYVAQGMLLYLHDVILTPKTLENHSYSNAHFIDAETEALKRNLLSIIPLKHKQGTPVVSYRNKKYLAILNYFFIPNP